MTPNDNLKRLNQAMPTLGIIGSRSSSITLIKGNTGWIVIDTLP